MRNKAYIENINTLSLLKFTIPTIVMMVFMSFYTIVDGIFVSRLIDTDALSAVNIVFPLINMVMAIGIMLGTGGSAIIARKLGEGKDLEAKEDFTFIIICSVIIGCVISFFSLAFMGQIILFLGANDAIYGYCSAYIFPLIFFFPASILQLEFQFFFVTAGKPKLGLAVIMAGGMANIVLDYVSIAIFNMGIAGAAVATGIGYCIPALVGLVYFFIKKNNTLHFVKPKANKKTFLQTCTNGSSEMVSNFSAAIITYLFNILMMHYLGPHGVAAITIVLYAEFLLIAIHLGYASGVAPIISYHYGKQENDKLKQLYKCSLKFIAIFSFASFILSIVLAKAIVSVFTPDASPVYDMAVRGFYLYSICYLFKGYNIFASSMFTAFSNGIVSAILSFMRTLVFIVLSIIILGYIFQVDGIWLSVPLAECLALILSYCYLKRYKAVYHYA